MLQTAAETSGRLRSFFRTAWIVPDVATVAAAVTFLYSIFLFPGYQKFFLDSDAGWHIRAGEIMVASGALPTAEPFSFTMQGAPWYAWEWGADVMIGTIHQKWGLSGVVFFYACAIAMGVWLWFQLNWTVSGNFFVACAFAAPMISTTTLHWLARPHIVSWLFLLGAVIFAERIRRSPRITPMRIVIVILGSCLWANLHGSFFFGALIPLVYAAGIWLSGLIWDEQRMDAAVSVRSFLMVAFTSALATLVNPYGWGLHLHVFRYLTDSELLSRIGEFQSFNFHTGGANQVILVLGLAALGGVLAIARQDLPVFFLTAILTAAGLHSARGLPLVALLLLPLANGVITRQLALWPGLRKPFRSALANFLDYSERLRELDMRASGWIWTLPLIALSLLFLRSPAIAAKTGFPSKEFPVAAAAQIELLPANVRILSTDKFGGYLIYRFAGRRKVFFDGRSDLYGAAFLKQCGRLMQARPGWPAILASYQFDYALLPVDYPLVSALEMKGWKPVYQDAVCTFLKRN